jgi:hypothetical protein
MYIAAITLSLCLLYFFLLFMYWRFFFGKKAVVPRGALRSIMLIALLSVCSFAVVYAIPDRVLANRFQHAIGGGFIAFIVCFLLVRDSKLPINKYQFFIFSFLVVNALGVANEILEFFLDFFINVEFAPTINDTWLDLISNNVGIILAALMTVPFISRQRNQEEK